MLQFFKRLREIIQKIRSYYFFMEMYVIGWKTKLEYLYKSILSFRWGKIEIFRNAVFIIRHELRAFGLDKGARLTRARARRAQYARLFTWKHLDAESFIKQLKRLYLQTRKFSRYTGFLQLYSFFVDAGYIKNLGNTSTKKSAVLANLATVRFSLLDRIVWPVFVYMSEIFETYIVVLQVFGFGFAFLGLAIFSWLPFVQRFAEWLFSSLLNIYGIYCWQRISTYMLIKTYVLGLLIYQVYLLADALLYFKAACGLFSRKDPILFFDSLYTIQTSLFGAFDFGKSSTTPKGFPQKSSAFWEMAHAYMSLTCIGFVFTLCVSPLGFALLGAYFTVLYQALVRSDYFEHSDTIPKEFVALEIEGFIRWLFERYPNHAEKYSRGQKPFIIFSPIQFAMYFEKLFSYIQLVGGIIIKLVFRFLSMLRESVDIVLKYLDFGRWLAQLGASVSPRLRRSYETRCLLEEIAEIIELRQRFRKWGVYATHVGELSPLLLTINHRAALIMDPIYSDGVFFDSDSYLPLTVSASGAHELFTLEARVYQKLSTLGILRGESPDAPYDLIDFSWEVVSSSTEFNNTTEEEEEVSEPPRTFVDVIPGDLSGTILEKLKDLPNARDVVNSWRGLDQEGEVIMARQRVSERGMQQVLDEENTRLVNWLQSCGVSPQNITWVVANSCGMVQTQPAIKPTEVIGAVESVFLYSFDDFKSTQTLLTQVIPRFDEHPFVEYLTLSGALKPETSFFDTDEILYFDVLEELEMYSKTGGLAFSYEQFLSYCDSPMTRSQEMYTQIFTEFFGTILATFGCLVLFFANEHWFYLSSLSAANIDILFANVAYKNLAFICEAIFYDYGDSGLLEEYSRFHDTCYALYTLQEGLVLPFADAVPRGTAREDFHEFPPYPELSHLPLSNSIGGEIIYENALTDYPAINFAGTSGIDELGIYEYLHGLSTKELLVLDNFFDKRMELIEDSAQYLNARKQFKDDKRYEAWLYRRKVFQKFWQNPFAVHRWPETLQTAWLDLRKPAIHPESALRAADLLARERAQAQARFDQMAPLFNPHPQPKVLFKEVKIQWGRLLPFKIPGLRFWLFEQDYPLRDYPLAYKQLLRDFLTEITRRMLYIRTLQPLVHNALVVDPLYVWPLVNIDRYLEYTDYIDILPEEHLDVALTWLFPESRAEPVFFDENEEDFTPVATFAELLMTPEYVKLDDFWDFYYLNLTAADPEDMDLGSDDDEQLLRLTHEEYFLEQMENECDIDLIYDLHTMAEVQVGVSRLPLDEPAPNLKGDVVLEPFWNEIPHEAWVDWYDPTEELLVDSSLDSEQEDHPLGGMAEEFQHNMFVSELVSATAVILEENPEVAEEIRANALTEGKELSDAEVFSDYLELRPQNQVTLFDEFAIWKHLKESWFRIKSYLYRIYFEDVVELGRGADDFFEGLDYDLWNAEIAADNAESWNYVFKKIFDRVNRLIFLFLYNYHIISIRYVNPYISSELWNNEVQQSLAEFLE